MSDIIGCRELQTPDIEQITRIKLAVEELRAIIKETEACPDYDARCRSLAITKLEECSMWATRAVARPTAG